MNCKSENYKLHVLSDQRNEPKLGKWQLTPNNTTHADWGNEVAAAYRRVESRIMPVRLP